MDTEIRVGGMDTEICVGVQGWVEKGRLWWWLRWRELCGGGCGGGGGEVIVYLVLVTL